MRGAMIIGLAVGLVIEKTSFRLDWHKKMPSKRGNLVLTAFLRMRF